MSPGPTVSWVILTMGDRPTELDAALDSIRRQSHRAAEIIVVGNGADPGAFAGVTTVVLEENVGITAGRNEGAAAATGDVLFFLDDDATCATDDLTAMVLGVLAERSDVAAVAMGITDPVSGQPMRRHVPRLRTRGADRSGDVTAFLGGASAIRADDFRGAGGYPAEFRYSMEETDLAWRLLDLGRSIHYLPAAAVHHPETEPARHGDAFVFTARNRVWLAHRRLPRLLALLYLAVWTPLMLIRAPTWAARRDIVRGLCRGVVERTPRPIERMGWRTVARMTRLGRPPVI